MTPMHEQYVQMYGAVGVPYHSVREMMRDRTLATLATPRTLPREWLHGGDAQLDVDLVGRRVARDVSVTIADFVDVPGRVPLGRVHLQWTPVDRTSLYPVLDADLEIEPINVSRTMVSILASYEPPLGRLGGVVDRLGMHRLAEATVRRFFSRLTAEVRAMGQSVSRA